ncbi:MAG: hypothetical protein ACT6Q8_05795 [Niveispirillum sp.]|uniref:hypothetical protein n=1 Tax=Niveispirillum sp. TaxID=1917217 RepID=UPI00403755D7
MSGEAQPILVSGAGGDEHDDAIPLYRRILHLSPLNYSAWVNMGTRLAWMKTVPVKPLCR